MTRRGRDIERGSEKAEAFFHFLRRKRLIISAHRRRLWEGDEQSHKGLLLARSRRHAWKRHEAHFQQTILCLTAYNAKHYILHYWALNNVLQTCNYLFKRKILRINLT